MHDFAGANSDDVLHKQPAGPFIPAPLPSSCPGTNGHGILQPAADANVPLPTQIRCNSNSIRDRSSSKKPSKHKLDLLSV